MRLSAALADQFELSWHVICSEMLFCRLWLLFSLFRSFSVNLRDVCAWKMSDAVSEILQPSHLAPTIMPSFAYFLPNCNAWFGHWADRLLAWILTSLLYQCMNADILYLEGWWPWLSCRRSQSAGSAPQGKTWRIAHHWCVAGTPGLFVLLWCHTAYMHYLPALLLGDGH